MVVPSKRPDAPLALAHTHGALFRVISYGDEAIGSGADRSSMQYSYFYAKQNHEDFVEKLVQKIEAGTDEQKIMQFIQINIGKEITAIQAKKLLGSSNNREELKKMLSDILDERNDDE